MNPKPSPAHDTLERIFHEPARLAIMSALCAADGPLSFAELKQTCDLTDGNLSRHLKALQDAEAVTVGKSFVGVKPRTTIVLSETGRERFAEYLEALAEVLEAARRALPARARAAPPPLSGLGLAPHASRRR